MGEEKLSNKLTELKTLLETVLRRLDKIEDKKDAQDKHIDTLKTKVTILETRSDVKKANIALTISIVSAIGAAIAGLGVLGII